MPSEFCENNPTGYCSMGQHGRCSGDWRHYEAPGTPVELIPCPCICHSKDGFAPLVASRDSQEHD